jgi:hypothetical protein
VKRLHNEVTMEGTFEVISLTDFRTRPGEVLQSVELGKTYVIQKYGREIAVLSKPPGTQLIINIASDGSVTHRP